MKAFVVGGAVRDGLLGEPVNDRDWVVTGASPQDMLDAGYLPVGKDFPVFLHPDTHEEYALARTERKTGPGYRGFEVRAAPDVTLEDDLRRRDLTINAIAQQADGTLVDPHHGQRDLQARVLRHVSEAFTEDPVRILRLARFAARWPEFSVAPETDALMKRMVEAGEVDALVAERVWQELSRGLMERAPARMFEVLRGVGALARLIPELDALFGVPQPPQHHPEIDTGVHTLMVLDRCAATAQPLPVRYACLVHDLGKGTTPADILPRHIGHEQRGEALIRGVNERLRVPADCGELALLTAREHSNIHGSGKLDATAVMRLLERCDALRRPDRFLQMLAACECDATGRLGLEDQPYPQRARLAAALRIAQGVDARAASARAIERGLKGEAIAAEIRRARVLALQAGLETAD
ncbi:MAG: multifunctional CCA addition/repair protein [Burkholderiales bacterium]|jgi:tRNA nucleotidyltransferase (CCA-adding enzyme)|nr:multifunctional CCA addition/repair protein [Burkholderiales bacterium]